MPRFSVFAALAGSLVVVACSPPAPKATDLKGEWTLDAQSSRLNYVTIKAGDIGEDNSFTKLSGSVSSDGSAKLDIDLASVKTGVDTRDQRMRDILFEVAQNPHATVSVKLDPKAFEGLKPGDRIMREVEALVSIKGVESEVPAELAVTRIANDRVNVSTAQPIIVDANAFELGEELEQLRKLANLPAISTAVPVTFSLDFKRQ